MQFVSEKMMKEPTVTVRVEPPGYSFHQFVLPASHLESPHFESLMKNNAQKEYGVNGPVYAMSCKLGDFLHAMVNTDSGAPYHPPVGEPLDEPSPPRHRTTIGWFLAN